MTKNNVLNLYTLEFAVLALPSTCKNQKNSANCPKCVGIKAFDKIKKLLITQEPK